jgi:hypothetical protein
MKVLFISTNRPDYQADAIFHGFYSLLGKDFTHNGSYELMYKSQTSKENLLSTSGRGFTMWGNIDENLNDNSDLESKIINRYFDLVIYGSSRRCLDYYELVNSSYDKQKIIFVDGEDDQMIYGTNGHPLFKRELANVMNGVFPISFAIPSCKIASAIPNKAKKLADYKPSSPGTGYVYTNEEDYYNNYKEALYGLTHKKSGWDCMRHYEILGNCCIPLFPDIHNCPSTTMANFPKELIKRSNQLFDTDCDEQYEILHKLFSYTKENLTTEELAKHVIDTIHKL